MIFIEFISKYSVAIFFITFVSVTYFCIVRSVLINDCVFLNNVMFIKCSNSSTKIVGKYVLGSLNIVKEGGNHQ